MIRDYVAIYIIGDNRPRRMKSIGLMHTKIMMKMIVRRARGPEETPICIQKRFPVFFLLSRVSIHVNAKEGAWFVLNDNCRNVSRAIRAQRSIKLQFHPILSVYCTRSSN